MPKTKKEVFVSSLISKNMTAECVGLGFDQAERFFQEMLTEAGKRFNSDDKAFSFACFAALFYLMELQVQEVAADLEEQVLTNIIKQVLR